MNVASIVGFTGFNGLSVYAATKASLIGFTRSLARELGRVGVTVNAVAPGFVATEMTHDLTLEDRERSRDAAHCAALRRPMISRRCRISAQRRGSQYHRHFDDDRCGRDRLIFGVRGRVPLSPLPAMSAARSHAYGTAPPPAGPCRMRCNPYAPVARVIAQAPCHAEMIAMIIEAHAGGRRRPSTGMSNSNFSACWICATAII